jgi:iron complex outermembrane receptor protein
MDYEAGWKATLLDGHLRTNVGAFAYDYKNFQIDGFDTTTGQSGVINIPNAKLHGLELQMQGKFGGFGFDMGYAYLSSKLGNSSFVNRRAIPPGVNVPQCQPGQQPGNPATCFDFTPYLASSDGKPMLYSPENTFNAGVDYTFKLAGNATLRPRLNYAYVDSQWAYILYSPQTDLLPSHSLLSAQLTLVKGAWLLEAYGTNLADRTFVTGQSGNNQIYNAPREYGLRGSIKF